MTFSKEIQKALEQIQNLQQQFRNVESQEMIPVSFFSLSYDMLKDIARTLSRMEYEQLKRMQENYISNKKSFLEISHIAAPVDLQPVLQEELDKPEEKKTSEPILEIEVPIREQISQAEPVIVEEPGEEEINQSESGVIPEEKEEKTSLEEPVMEEKPYVVSEAAPEQPFLPLLKEEKKVLADLRKTITLNDRFRFQRELFNGSADEMSQALAQLNEFSSLEDTCKFLEKEYNWDEENETFRDFKAFLEKRFI